MTRSLLMATVAAAAVAVATPAAAQQTLVMQSIYASSLPLLGDTGASLGDRVSALTGGELEIEFNEPGALVASNEIWDAVSTGAVDAGWYSPGFAQGIIPAAPIFTAVPFGPDVREYTAWWYEGGGEELWNEIGARYNVHSELCTILVPEASGWFANPIESPEDLQGLRMRVFGLGANVFERLGVAAQALPPAEAMTGLNTGQLDAAEISFPAIDLSLGLHEHASHYYFPGWHQQTSLITFIVNTDVWEGMEERHRLAIQEVCRANVALTMARGEAMQLEPMAELREAGVTFHQWNDTMMEAFETAWNEVAAELAAEDEDFARAWESLSSFRESYREWGDLGYVD